MNEEKMNEEKMNEEKQIITEGNNRQKKQNISIHTIILILAIGIFLYSGCKLFLIISEYWKGDKEYESIAEEVIIENTQETQDETQEGVQEKFQVDFDKLRAMNPEAVAWIRFEEPAEISYPVVQGKDNSKYLKTTFEGKTNSAGTLFVDANNAGDFTDRNTFIYGHNMKNGSMFGQLRKYKDASYCKENPYFYIYTPDGAETRYRIFAVCIVEDASASYDKYYENDDEYLQYLAHVQQVARYSASVELTAQSQIVSLSTCTNVTETQRLLVHGVKMTGAEGLVEE